MPAGSNLSYQIGIVNNGPATAQNVVLNDVLPTGPTFVSATFTGGTIAGTCTTPAVGATGGTFNCTFPALTNGQSSNYNVILAVPAGSTGSLSNTATVASATTDPTPANNSATAGTAINSNADLSITKTDSPDPVPAGSNLSYQIGIVNNGPATAQNVVLNDVLPIGPTFVSATFTGGTIAGTCTTPAVGATGGTFNCTFPALTNGQSSNYNVILAVPAGSTGSLSNTATVSSATTDPTPANNSATAGTAINSNADLSITKTDSPDPVPAGSNLSYQIGIVNNGPATAQNVVLNDVLPIGPTFVSATFTGGTIAGTCTTPAVGATGGTFNCTFPALTNGQSSNYNVILAVPAGSTGSLSNTATVSSATTDPTPANNSATAGTAINSNADLSITKTDSPDPVPAGSNLSYQIGIVNNGPATAQNVVLNDVLPIGPTFVSATFTGGTTAGTCTTPAVGATGGTFNCTFPALTNGQSSNYNVILAVPAGSTGSLSNTATVASATTDPTPANNSATATTTILSATSLNKAFAPTNIAVGGTTTLTFTLTNPPTNNPAQVVSFVDSLPSKLQIAGVPNIINTCTGGTVTATAGGSTINVSGTTVPASTATAGTCSISVSVTNAAGQTGTCPDANLTNASANISGTVNIFNAVTASCVTVTAQADVGVTNSDGTASAVPGMSTTYTIVVSNAGPTTATSVAVSDPLPAGATSGTWSGTNGSSGTGALTDTIASLASGSTVTYTFSVQIGPSATGTLVNTVTVTAANDPNSSNNTATDTDSLTPQVDVGVTKTDGKTTVLAGSSNTYTIVVTNSGPSTATNVAVSDPLPAGVTSATWSGTNGHSGTGALTDTIASLTPGASVTYTFIAQVSPTATGNLVNTATVTAANDTNAGNNTATDTDTVTVNGNTFSMTKVASAASLSTGSPLSYTITVTNNGPSSADGSALTDPAVAGFSASGIICTGATGGAACPAPANVTIGNLQGAGIVLLTFPASSTITFQLSGTFTQTAGSVVNTATVSTPAGVPLQTSSAAATVTVQIVAPANIPTTSDRALLVLMLLLAIAGVIHARRTRR